MPTLLNQLATALGNGAIQVIDLSQSLQHRTPIISLPPQYGQSAPFRMDEISRYDERGPGWYWNNFSCGEHTGTHFDAPVHWITGKDFPDNTTDAIPVRKFIAPACVIDVSERVKDDNDYSPHREPFQYYPSTANPKHIRPASLAVIGQDGDKANHQYDLHDWAQALQAGNLPAVSFLKPKTIQSGHSGESDPLDEQD